MLLVLEPGLPGDELAFDKGVVLVEPVGELFQHPLADFGGIVCPGFVRHAKDREASFGSVRAHVALASFVALSPWIARRNDRIGRSSDVHEPSLTKVGRPAAEFGGRRSSFRLRQWPVWWT